MDKEQIIYKLKNAIEQSKLQEFEKECTGTIQTLDDYIRVILSVLIFSETMQE